MSDTKNGLRLVPNPTREDVVCEAVERASMHARHKSFTWQQHLRNLDTFLEMELDPEGFEEKGRKLFERRGLRAV